MKVVAIKDMSAGNEQVGEMWQETKIFPLDTPVIDVIRWAARDTTYFEVEDNELRLHKRLTLTTSEEWTGE